ncbi:crossover junction endonuclease EME1-like isoform X1 [Watersipora subatra]|uniref:crossover junction endonuclease EME1-like isoform X1 n=1 Tax=Watersipora subatra TaxID=2589382 RepID=UPI00355C33FA
MECIDLLDDSDDDIPLFPASKNSSPTSVTPTVTKQKLESLPSMPSETIELSSSDDEELMLEETKTDVKTLKPIIFPNYDSEKTEEYSGSTERYSCSSDLESLPDINADMGPLTNHNSDFQAADFANQQTDQEFFNQSSQHVQVNNLTSICKEDVEFTQIKKKRPPSSLATEKVAKRTNGKEEKVLIQQKKREEKERKELEKKRAIAMKVAEREARRAAQPGECHRHMLLEVDKNVENTTLGVCISAMCLANSVPLTYTDTPAKNVILFKRKHVSSETSTTSYHLEDNMAVVLPMTDMVQLVEPCTNDTSVSLGSYVDNLRKACQSKPSIIVVGCEKYFRSLKTQSNRVHKDNILGTQHHSRKNKTMKVVTRLQYEEAVTALQITSDTAVINLETEERVAKTLLRLNKAIAEVPVKRGKYEKQALSVKTTGLRIGKNSEGCLKVWQRMLQESRNISSDVSSSIITEWPSPYMLYQAYKSCSSAEEAELLLQDIRIRRGGGVVQTTRRVGKETSRRIYELFTKQGDHVII